MVLVFMSLKQVVDLVTVSFPKISICDFGFDVR